MLGGIGLSGGRGGVLNVIIGTLLIGTMLNGMTIMDIPYAGQNLIKGVVLLLAVITDRFSTRAMRRRHSRATFRSKANPNRRRQWLSIRSQERR